MVAMGVELEADTRSEVQIYLEAKDWKSSINAPVPSIDSLQTYLRVLKLAPSAIGLEKTWTKGVPNSYRLAGAFLEQHTGYSFPLLDKLTHKRAIRALTTILRDNLDPENSEIGIANKCLAGLV